MFEATAGRRTGAGNGRYLYFALLHKLGPAGTRIDIRAAACRAISTHETCPTLFICSRPIVIFYFFEIIAILFPTLNF